MTKTKFAQTIAFLSPGQCIQFIKFLKSPYFNQRKDILQLSEWLITNRISSPDVLNKSNAWKLIHPDAPYDDQKFRLILSYAFKQLKKFLAYEAIEDDHQLLQIKLSESYNQLKLEDHYKKALADGIKQLEKQPLRDALYLQKKHQFEYKQYQYYNKLDRSQSFNLKSVSDSFDHWYIAGKLKFACIIASNNMVIQSDNEVQFIQFLLAYLEQETSLLDIPAIRVYYYGYLTMTHEDHEQCFQKLWETIQQCGHQFEQKEIKDIYIIAINYCTRQMNLGVSKYVHLSFDLYKNGIEKGYLIENNQISQYSFSNIVFCGISVKAFDWVNEFIETYQSYLPPQSRASIYYLTSASLEYHRKNYDKALSLLNKFETKGALLELKARNLRLKVYYETEAFDLLEYHLNNMIAYLNRKEVSPRLKMPYKQFVQLTNKLMRVKRGDKINLTLLNEQISQVKVKPFKSWLIQQYDLL